MCCGAKDEAQLATSSVLLLIAVSQCRSIMFFVFFLCMNVVADGGDVVYFVMVSCNGHFWELSRQQIFHDNFPK